MKEIPSSIYRFQLSQDFGIRSVIDLIPYLFELGLEGIYCSPIFEACSHGYDVTNPCKLNPLLGTPEDFEELCATLQKYGMKHVLDVVPNHMGMRGNPWWLDVLEKGPTSAFAEFFDVNWTPEKQGLRGKILLPILNQPYGSVLEKRGIQLLWKEGFWVSYADYQLPVCFSTYSQILERASQVLSDGQEKDWLECLALSKTGSKEQFVSFYQKSQFVQRRFGELLAALNKKIDFLHELLEKQFYRLAYWVVAGQEINYRRFFNINELIALHIEKEKVLNIHHRWIFDLLESGKVQGLRVDHPDGLYDPRQYFERVRREKPAFIWVEKILDFREPLPEHWDVDGTVGYDYLNVLSGLFIQKKNEQMFTKLYNQFIEQEIDLKEIWYERRKRYINLQMSSEVNYLGQLLDEISDKNRYYRDFTKIDLTRALREIFACFPVYRTYIRPGFEVGKKDREYVSQAVEVAKKRAPEVDVSIFDYIKSLLLQESLLTSQEQDLGYDFILRFQQLTAPVMAKGLEDSTFYIYNRLISLNEVGGSPRHFGFSKAEFHEFNKQKLTHWPRGALASSTHDTKYSEDARLRIHALSEIPKVWESAAKTWKKHNQKYKTKHDGDLFPDLNTEYFIYQMLLGLWPADQERIWRCLNKAIREAGIYTSWHKVNAPYETAVKHFLESLLRPQRTNLFYPSFLRIQRKIAEVGLQNSLSALVLKIGSCGVVDIYQGNECVNLALMDPDNRFPVDFALRKKSLKQTKDLKIMVTAKALKFRRENKELFLEGDYIPLKSPENVVAFMRQYRDKQVVIATGRFYSEGQISGRLNMPKGQSHKLWQDLFTGKKVSLRQGGFDLSEAFEKHPFAILTPV